MSNNEEPVKLCRKCGKFPRVVGRTICAECCREEHRSGDKRRRAALRKKQIVGNKIELCICCSKRRAMEGVKICAECRQEVVNTRAKMAAALGIKKPQIKRPVNIPKEVDESNLESLYDYLLKHNYEPDVVIGMARDLPNLQFYEGYKGYLIPTPVATKKERK